MSSRLPKILLLLFGLAVPAASQAPDPSTFLLDGLVVEGVKSEAGRAIVTAESLLVLGRQYTDEEIRLALYRVRRLPFVLHADVSLRDGMERGSREVVFEIEATHAFFLYADVGGARVRDARGDDDGTEWSASAEAGGRLFVGGTGLLTGSISGFDGVGPNSVQVGYTRFGLFGRGAKANVALRSNVDRDDGDIYDASGSLEVPIVGDHSLRTDLSWFQSKSDGSGFDSRNESRSAAVAWLFDTTDDPLFATRGTSLSAGVRYGELEQSFRSADFSADDESSGYGASVQGRRSWTLNARNSVYGDASLSWDRSKLSGFDGDRESTFSLAGVGHGFDILGTGAARRGLDLRWENNLSVVSGRFESPFGSERTTDGRLTTGLALRSSWGLARLSFTYIDNLSQDFRTAGGPL